MKVRNLPHKDHWQTPPFVKRQLDAIFKFDFDPCPYKHNIDLWNGLEISWGERNYINPPYSDKKESGYLKSSFVKKAITESQQGKLCVMLLPVSTSTVLFHKHLFPNLRSLFFVEKRIPFIGINQHGQHVNFHLLDNAQIDTSEIIHTDAFYRPIPKYIKAAGQHDSMIVVFDNLSLHPAEFKPPPYITTINFGNPS